MPAHLHTGEINWNMARHLTEFLKTTLSPRSPKNMDQKTSRNAKLACHKIGKILLFEFKILLQICVSKPKCRPAIKQQNTLMKPHYNTGFGVHSVMSVMTK